MQQNIVSQNVRRIQTLTIEEIGRGTFVEVYAGIGAVARAVRLAGGTSLAYEAFPASGTDSGIAAAVRLPAFDLCEEDTLLQLLTDVYGGRITSIHFGTPCHSWSTLYQNCGPGVRSQTRWWGSAENPIEVFGNRTMGATVVLMRALWEMGGSFTFEHPLRSKAWGLKAFHTILGWVGVQTSRIDRCEYGLKPGDQPHMRYFKPTGIMHSSPQPFLAKRCRDNHEHVKIESGYRCNGKTIRRSTEAGAYPWRLAQALAGVHVSALRRAIRERRGLRGGGGPLLPCRA